VTAQQFDVVIAGAGLPALALAPAIARAGLRVALLDRTPISAPEAPSDTWDPRVYAISPGSAAFLQRVGAWQRLPIERLTAVESMHIEGDSHGRLQFSAYDLGERALAWIVEERALRAALLPAVHGAGVSVLGDAGFASLAWSTGDATLVLANGEALSARLIVGADGIRSWVRSAAGLVAMPKPYGQTAVVAHFACERADGGVLAWLPLPERRVSMVWSAPDALAEALLALAPAELAARVAAAGSNVLGEFTPLGPASGFPLQFLRLPTSVAHRLALVGDAAHGLHPLAGQGVNLGFGDAEALSGVLAERGPVDDPGAPALLTRYARRRAEPVLAMQAVTDGLARLFGTRMPWVRVLRNFGLSAVDRLPVVKRALAQPALR
jgi:2-octaprenylphenol hydroxylase